MCFYELVKKAFHFFNVRISLILSCLDLINLSLHSLYGCLIFLHFRLNIVSLAADGAQDCSLLLIHVLLKLLLKAANRTFSECCDLVDATLPSIVLIIFIFDYTHDDHEYISLL